MSVGLAFIAYAAWGFSTFEAAYASRTWGALRLTAWSQLTGVLLYLPLLFVLSHDVSPLDIGRGSLAGVGSGTGVALLYEGCLRIPAGLAAAMSGLFGAVVPLVYSVVSGTARSPLTVASVGLCIAATTLVVLSGGPGAAHNVFNPSWYLGLLIVALSGCALGLYYIELAAVHDKLTGAIAARLIASLTMFPTLKLLSRAIRPPRTALRAMLLVAASGAVGTITYAEAASAANMVAIVAIVSLSPALTALLAWRFAGQRITSLQTLGLGLSVIGAAAASAAALY